MAKDERNEEREERITMEIVVDAYGPEEQAMGWYYYLQDPMQFPFTATCISKQRSSPLKEGATVEVGGWDEGEFSHRDSLIWWQVARFSRSTQSINHFIKQAITETSIFAGRTSYGRPDYPNGWRDRHPCFSKVHRIGCRGTGQEVYRNGARQNG
jgi:hypothetical protein